MANKIEPILEKLKTAYAAISGLREIRRGLVLPGTSDRLPALGIVADRLWREDTVWHCTVSLMLICRNARGEADADVIDLIGEIDAATTTLRDGGSAGGLIDGPTFDVWVSPMARGGPMVQVGQWGQLTISVTEPLKVEEEE